MASLTYDFTPAPPNTDDVKRKHLEDYYRRVGSFCDQAYEEASATQRDVPEVKDIQQSIDYLVGLQWKEATPSYKAKPVSNEILSNFWETIGLLTDIKPIFHVKQISMDSKYSKTTDILNAGAKAWAKQTTFNQRMAFWTMFAMFTTAPVHLYWNPTARGDDPSDPANGDMTMEVLPTTSLLRLGCDGYGIQDDEMVIYSRKRTLNWIKRKYPSMGKLVTPEDSSPKYTVDLAAPPDVMPRLFENLSGGMKRLMGGTERSTTQSVYPTAVVREFWMKDDSTNDTSKTVWVGPEGASWGYRVKPGKALYPRGRVVVRANRVTLYDEPNPYFHRRKPFVQMGLYAVPWQEYALSVIGPWMKQQDILNQIMAGVLQCVKKAVSPALMAPKSAIHPDALKAINADRPNLKISYNSNAATAPVWQTPPNVPAYVFNAYGIVQKAMRQSSGAEAMDSALGKKQVPGGDTLDRIQFSKTTPIRHMGGNIETAADELGEQWTGNFLQFYDAAKRTEMFGSAGLTKEDVDDQPGSLIPSGINSEEFVRQWHFECERGSLLNVNRQDKVQIGFALRKNHDLSRPQLFKLLDWNIDQEANDAELAKEAQAMAGAMAAKGHK